MSDTQREADLLSEVERLRGVLADVLCQFIDAATAGGRPIPRTSWIAEATIDRWHHALAGTQTPPGAPALDPEPPAAPSTSDRSGT